MSVLSLYLCVFSTLPFSLSFKFLLKVSNLYNKINESFNTYSMFDSVFIFCCCYPLCPYILFLALHPKNDFIFLLFLFYLIGVMLFVFVTFCTACTTCTFFIVTSVVKCHSIDENLKTDLR